ncbi:MAG: hypothetical protein R6V01_02620 [Thermoplasmatota archaeon]
MDRIGEIRKSTMAVLVLISLVMAALVVITPVPDADAGVAEERDEYGYYWTDNRDPDPKVEYNWINAVTSGTELDISGNTGMDNILLDFDFEIYNNTYDEIYVGSRGFVVFDNETNPGSDYNWGIPLSDSYVTGPMIHVAFGYPSNDNISYGGVHYLKSPPGAHPKWVCVEWNMNSEQMTYEVILYDGGLIKMQYNNMGSSSYGTGQSMSVGIQDEKNSTVYSDYSQSNMESGLAIEYSTEEMFLEDLKLEDGDGEMEHTVFAEHRYYELSFNVSSSSGYQDVSLVRVYFGDPALNIFARLVVGGGSHRWESGGGSGHYDIDVNRSRDMTLPNPQGLEARLYIMFDLDIPLDGNISVTLWGRGFAAMPNITVFEDALYLDSVVRIQGEITAFNGAGEELESEDYVRDFDNITFTGVWISYNTTSDVYPPDSSFLFQVTDDELITHYDMNASGRNMSVWFVMPDVAIRKVFTPAVRDGNGDPFEDDKLMGTMDSMELRVDDSYPLAPASLSIRADSFKDSQRDMDNDDKLYISWSSVSDAGSGVSRYKIWTNYEPMNEEVYSVDSTTTQYVWNSTEEGVFKIFVWAEDGVGHQGEYIDQSIKIDKKDPFFVDFYPSKIEVPWIRTLTPDVGINVKDNLTISDAVSGVRPSTVEYSISTEGVDNFQEWISADLYDVEEYNPEDTIEVRLKPRLVEGSENYIRYRAKDYAGNGFAYSDTYNLQVDVTPVDFQEFFPTTNVWHDMNVITQREISVYLVDETSGVLTSEMYYRISDSYDEKKGEYDWVTGVPQENGWVKMTAKQWDRVEGSNKIWVHFPYEDYKTGDQNFVQFMVRDVARNGKFKNYKGDTMTLSPMYQIKVNTKPVAKITSPTLESREFEITELITFDASDSYDVDVDKGNLKYEWFVRELNKTIGYDEVLEDIRFETTGWYNVTLYVGDSVHRYDPYTGEDTRSKDSIRVRIYKWEPEEGVDTDGDGMPDTYEYDSLLDPFDPEDKTEDFDLDGYTNFQEFKAGTDPWDPTSKPARADGDGSQPVKEAPFNLWVFIAILVAAIIIAGVVVLIGYLRIQKLEQREKTEEAEEEAMLATPQLDIPSMPAGMPMVDTSVPTLPGGQGGEEAAALPPAQEAQPMEGEQPMPAPDQPVGQSAPSETQEQQSPPQPQEQYADPNMQAAPENPMYSEQPQQEQNSMYEQQ